MPRKSWIIIGGGAIAAIAILYGTSLFTGGPEELTYLSAPAIRSPILQTVAATGKVNALVTVEVGSQLSGQIVELFVDFNSEVVAGQIIARLDDSTFQARVAQAEADVASAEANVAVAQAALEEVRVQLWEAQRALERKTTLRRNGVINASELDVAIGGFRGASARVRSREAQLKASEAQAEQRRAALQNALVDLDRANIRSPVTGIVIERAIDVGQTVAASFQAPKLFQIAQDLSDMQLEVNIDEADIGIVAEGQAVQFTVDAYPDDIFIGEVVQIRRAPEEVQNLVAYKVIASVANAEDRLLPGMTANVAIIIAARESALTVAASALRFTPPWMPDASFLAGPSAAGPATFSIGANAEGIANQIANEQRVWKRAGGQLVPVAVTTGINDGTNVEILSGDLREGDEVITGLAFSEFGGGFGGPGFGGGRRLRF